MHRRVKERAGLERIWRTQILPLLEERHLGEHPDVAGYVRDRYGLDALYSAVAKVNAGAAAPGGS